MGTKQITTIADTYRALAIYARHCTKIHEEVGLEEGQELSAQVHSVKSG